MTGCQRCGHDNETSARFCVHCGSAIAAQPAAPAQSSRLPSGGYSTRPSTPGSPPPLIVPGTAAMNDRAAAVHSPVASDRQGGGGQNLAFAETAPPLLDADLNRPIPDRGLRRPRADAGNDPSSPRVTHNPPSPYPVQNHYPEQRVVDPLSVPADAPRVLAGFLVTYEGNALGQSWSVHQGANWVGRVGAAAGTDIELPHATVSSRHAVIYASAHPGRLVLRDQGSTNGSFVNDTVLQPEDPRELRDGDRVRLGLFTVVVKII